MDPLLQPERDLCAVQHAEDLHFHVVCSQPGSGEEDPLRLRLTLRSVEDMEEYLRYLVHTAIIYRDFASPVRFGAKEIKRYIHAHYGDDWPATCSPEMVYLKPEYLARLF